MPDTIDGADSGIKATPISAANALAKMVLPVITVSRPPDTKISGQGLDKVSYHSQEAHEVIHHVEVVSLMQHRSVAEAEEALSGLPFAE